MSARASGLPPRADGEVVNRESHAMTALQWNARYGADVPVTYYPIRLADGRLGGNPVRTRTHGLAFTANNGLAVVFLDNISGYVAVDHCVPVIKSTALPTDGEA